MELTHCELLEIHNEKILYNKWNHGFYSNTFQTFISIIQLLNQGIIPDKIDFSKGFCGFKRDKNKNIYPKFYKLNLEQLDLPLNKNLFIPNANKIKDESLNFYNFTEYSKIINRFFYPNLEVLSIHNKLIQKYNINFEKTICVFIRGTDKYHECTIPQYDDILFCLKKLIEKEEGLKVLIQTDQKQLKDFIINNIDNKICFFFEEVIMTETKTATWRIISEDLSYNPTYMAQLFDAVIRICSKCKYVINHTGNCGTFLNLYRGNLENIYQYNEDGHLIKNCGC